MNKRERWFGEGALLLRNALERTGRADRLPNDDPYYACPCCLLAFPFDAVAAQALTIEHVPPEALSGKAMLLTCKRCNNEAGTDFDSHAYKRAEFHNMMSGRGMKRPMRAVFEAGGIKINGEAQSSGNGWYLEGVPRQNRRENLDAHDEALRALSDRGEASDFKFTITERYSTERADVSWIRSAYLAAFSALGWSYILQPALDPIRQRFKSDASSVLPSIICFNPETETDAREMMIVQEPQALSGLLVIIGHYSVWLPDPWATLSLDQLHDSLSQLRDDTGKVQYHLKGKVVPWPSEPMYLLDRPNS